MSPAKSGISFLSVCLPSLLVLSSRVECVGPRVSVTGSSRSSVQLEEEEEEEEEEEGGAPEPDTSPELLLLLLGLQAPDQRSSELPTQETKFTSSLQSTCRTCYLRMNQCLRAGILKGDLCSSCCIRAPGWCRVRKHRFTTSQQKLQSTEARGQNHWTDERVRSGWVYYRE